MRDAAGDSGSRSTVSSASASAARHPRALLAQSAGRQPQAQLVAELRRQGLRATQSSVSRDLRDLGVARIGGHYVPRAPRGEGDDGGRDPRASPR